LQLGIHADRRIFSGFSFWLMAALMVSLAGDHAALLMATPTRETTGTRGQVVRSTGDAMWAARFHV